MIIYKSYLTFKFFGQEVNLISSETDYGTTTTAEMPNQYYYLGNERANIVSAIFAWQETNDRLLTNKELHQVMCDNGFIETH